MCKVPSYEGKRVSSHHQLLHFADFLITAQFLGHPICTKIILFSFFFLIFSTVTSIQWKEGTESRVGNGCYVTRRDDPVPRSAEALKTWLYPHARVQKVRLHIAQGRNPALCCPSKTLRMYFKISRCCVTAMIPRESKPGRVSPACPAATADPVTGRQKTRKK